MDENKVYLSFGRHGRYGIDTAIEHMRMLESFLGGRRLALMLPPCDAVYYSPIPRAAMTAKFRAQGLQCRHLLGCRELQEDMTSFIIKRFIGNIIQNSGPENKHYHFVTHLPVVEKLGLPELEACGICICSAVNWQEMLAENFEVIKLKNPSHDEIYNLLKTLRIEPEELEKFSPDGIYSALSRTL